MFSSDVNVNLAVERSVERVRAVQAYETTSTARVRWLGLVLGLMVLVTLAAIVVPALI
jgi:hypothetical protein